MFPILLVGVLSTSEATSRVTPLGDANVYELPPHAYENIPFESDLQTRDTKTYEKLLSDTLEKEVPLYENQLTSEVIKQTNLYMNVSYNRDSFS